LRTSLRVRALYGALGLLVGVFFTLLVVLLLLLDWIEATKDATHFRVFELLQLLVQVGLAFIIAAFINRRLSYNVKKRELVGTLVERARDKTEQIYALGLSYMADPKEEHAREILREFKHLDRLIGNLKHVQTNAGSAIPVVVSEDFTKDFRKFKKLLTDSPFNGKDAKYEEKRINDFGTAYPVT
jgi:hypothetical protein